MQKMWHHTNTQVSLLVCRYGSVMVNKVSGSLPTSFEEQGVGREGGGAGEETSEDLLGKCCCIHHLKVVKR